MFFCNSCAFSMTIWYLVPLPSLNPAWTSGISQFHVLLKPGLENFEHYFASMWDECNCVVVWTFLGSLIAQLVKNLPAMQETWFEPWVGKITWGKKRLPTPVFWPEEFQGLYSPWGCKELDMTEGLSLSLTNNLPLSLCPHSQGHLIYSNIFFAPCLAKVDAQLIIKARCSKEQVFHVEHMPLDWASKYKAN